MKHYKAVLAFCALLLLLPCRAYAAGYTELTAELPISFRNDSSIPHTCTAVMEPIDGAPAPEQSELTLEGGEEGQFVLRFSQPCKVQYRIYQTAKDESGILYDESVYTVTVVVRNAENGGLTYSYWASLNGDEKADAVQFVNRARASEPETPLLTVPLDDNVKSPKTGDGSRFELYFAAAELSALMLLFAVTAEKRKRKEGDSL